MCLISSFNISNMFWSNTPDSGHQRLQELKCVFQIKMCSVGAGWRNTALDYWKEFYSKCNNLQFQRQMPNTKCLKCELIEMCFDFCSNLVTDGCGWFELRHSRMIISIFSSFRPFLCRLSSEREDEGDVVQSVSHKWRKLYRLGGMCAEFSMALDFFSVILVTHSWRFWER